MLLIVISFHHPCRLDYKVFLGSQVKDFAYFVYYFNLSLKATTK